MKLIFFKEINSTNTYSKLNINNLEDKSVVYTDFQTNGRGRFDRTWVDLGEENIYMSIVLKPIPVISEKNSAKSISECLKIYSNLTQYLSVCLCKQLEELGLNPKIKWPNDVLINNKKISGILAESIIKGGELKGIVLGIGINLNADRKNILKIDRPATSLNLELGRTIDKQKFMEKLLENFFKDYDNFLEHGFKFIKKDYENRASFLNQNLKVAIFDIVKKGYAKGLDEAGNLILLDEQGKIHNINMGEII